MTAKRDYYEVLEISREASPQEVKSAYRKVAMRFHPDRNPGDPSAEERFKEAAEAYAVLSDTEKRARYDRFGHRGVDGGGFQGFDPSTFGDFADILGDFFGFGDLFGGRRRRGSAAEPGADLRYELGLSFEEAAFGTETTLRIPRLEACPKCDGSGSAGEGPKTCATCGGRGQVHFSQGFFTVARTCPHCGGRGVVVTDPCSECRGAGRVERERSIQVKIPAGVDTGARLRLAGEGEHGARGGRTGDLYVVVRVESHPRYHREGPHVWTEEEISFPQAVLGAEIEVETLHGPEKVEIPAGTQPGRELRLAGKGIPALGGNRRGDHYVRVRVAIPNPHDLGEEEIELLRQLAQLGGTPVREHRKVLDRVRDLFA